MKGLLLRLSGLDADAESAVRVIAFFDQLVADHASLDALLHATAVLAECPVGLDAPRRGIAAQAHPPTMPPAEGPAHRQTRPLLHGSGAVVWLERAGGPLRLDEILLERFALAAALLLDPPQAGLPELGDPALVELLLDEGASDLERARALHLLGIRATAEVQAVAFTATGSADQARVVETLAPAGDNARILPADLGAERAAVLVGATVATDYTPPPGVRMGIGSVALAGGADRSWRAARTALRFASARPNRGAGSPGGDLLAAPPVVRWEELGPLALFAEHIPVAAIGEDRDVTTIDAVARGGGQEILATLRALAATGSVRQAAARLHLHHSSVAARLARAQAILGFPLDTPAGRLRLATALMLRNLRDSAS